MVSVLRSNNFITIFLLVVIFILIKLPFYFFYQPTFIEQSLLFKQIPIFQFKYDELGFVVAQICIVVQSIWFNQLFLNSDLYPKPSLMSVYIFILLSSTIASYNYFNFYHILIFLFLSMYSILLSIYQKTQAKSEAFNIGFLFGVFIFIFPNGIVLLPFILMLFYILKAIVFKELLILISGTVAFWLYTLSITYLFDLEIANPFDFYIFNFNAIKPQQYLYFLPIVTTIILLFFSFFSLRGIAFASTSKRMKNVNLIAVLLFGFAFTVLFNIKYFPDIFCLLFIPFTFFFSLMWLRTKKKIVIETINFLFLLTIFIIHFYKMFN